MPQALPSISIPFGVAVGTNGNLNIAQIMPGVNQSPAAVSRVNISQQQSGAYLKLLNNSDSGLIIQFPNSGTSFHIEPGGKPMIPIPPNETQLLWSIEYQNPFQAFPAQVLSPTFYYPHEITGGSDTSSINPNPPASSITPGKLAVGVQPGSPVDLTSLPSTTVTPAWQFTSIDTMKDSMDTSAPANQLPYTTILQDCQLASSLGVTHITCDVFYDYPAYMAQWVKAIRAVGKKVWFRCHWNNWEGNNGQPANMTPTQYRSQMVAFVAANLSLFKAGDIFDGCPEANNSPYWNNTYGAGWTSGVPNPGTDAFNAFILGVKTDLDTALASLGPVGTIITGIRSATTFMYTNVIYAATIASLGYITIDSYPEAGSTDPATCAAARIADLSNLLTLYPTTNFVLGEIGYNQANTTTDDATQLAVLQAELLGIGTQPGLNSISQIVGMNYWVGPGSATFDGTRIFDGSRGNFFPKPAGVFLATFYQTMLGTNGYLIGGIYPGQIQAGTMPPAVDIPLADGVATYDGTTLEIGRNWVGTTDPRTLANVPAVRDGDTWFNPAPSGNLDNTVGKFGYGWYSFMALQSSANQAAYTWLASITGTLQSISFFGDGDGAGVTNVFGCLWDNTGVLLANTPSIAVTGGQRKAGGQSWHTVSFAAPPTLTSGVTYKIGWENDKTKTLDWSTYKPGAIITPFSGFTYYVDAATHPANLGTVYSGTPQAAPGIYFVVRVGANTMKIGISRNGIWTQIV